MFNLLKLLKKTKILTKEQLASWENNGYLVLKKFFEEEDLALYERELENIIHNRKEKAGQITIDVLEGELVGKRLRLKEAPDQVIQCSHKINDLFLESESCRNINLNEKLCLILGELLHDKPLIINSLSFRKGSQQPYHFDTYYMPPPVLNKMVVSSICIEDQTENSGPICYYPGSHKIPPYVFSHGGINAISDEMPFAENYIQKKIKELDLKPEIFIGKAGDVFIWHAQLYHGGAPIKNHSITRKTLVTHYWRKRDVLFTRRETIKDKGSYLKRKHQKA